ncbi:hypothetical protein [Streptomyces sp. NPDC001604]
MVIHRFPSVADARAWYESPADRPAGRTAAGRRPWSRRLRA